jgi:hypothetical protein
MPWLFSRIIPSKQPAPKYAADRTFYFLTSTEFGGQFRWWLDKMSAVIFIVGISFAAMRLATTKGVAGRFLA